MERWKWRGRDELQSRQPLGQIAAWIPPNDTLSHHRTGTLSEAHPQSAAATAPSVGWQTSLAVAILCLLFWRRMRYLVFLAHERNIVISWCQRNEVSMLIYVSSLVYDPNGPFYQCSEHRWKTSEDRLVVKLQSHGFVATGMVCLFCRDVGVLWSCLNAVQVSSVFFEQCCARHYNCGSH